MKAMNKSIYLVKYEGGDHDGYYDVIIFATQNLNIAKKYIAKFNKILRKWKKHYKQYETKQFGFNWIKEEHTQQHFDRWYQLRNISKAYYIEIEVR